MVVDQRSRVRSSGLEAFQIDVELGERHGVFRGPTMSSHRGDDVESGGHYLVPA